MRGDKALKQRKPDTWKGVNARTEARQDSNIIMGTFTLNDHYATTLFDFGADYSFVSTTFIPLLGIVPSDLGFSYEIKITSGKLVEIDKVIRSCKLEIEGHMFDNNLIPFKSKSFDGIIGMDWLSNHKDEIIYHKKVVRIPLPNGKVLRVIKERPEENMGHLLSAKAKEQKQEEIVVVRDFPEVFPDDLSGLPPIREIKFRIELIPGAIPVTKSLYRLAPSKMEEFSSQLKELQDKGVNEEHLGSLKKLLKEEKLYAKFSKCEFWLRYSFLDMVIIKMHQVTLVSIEHFLRLLNPRLFDSRLSLKDQKILCVRDASDLGQRLCVDAEKVQFKRNSLTRFPAQSVRSSNADALDSPYLLVLNIGTSQSRQHDMSESDSYYLFY
ncbi:putative reverse transcriptase domain-containing protein [Tanacetum coccineum]